MEKRILIIAGVVLALLAALCVCSVAIGGIVFAATQIRSGTQDQVLDSGSLDATGIDPNQGVLVQSVDPDGPAGRAGVVRGDIILRVAGVSVDGPRQLLDQLDARQPGESILLEILHGDELKSLTIIPDEDRGLGLAVAGGGVDPGPPFGQFESSGALLMEVLPGTPAERAGLEPGMRVVAVDGRALDPDFDLATAVGEREPGDVVTLSVETPAGELREVDVQLGENPDQEGRAYLGVTFQSIPSPGDPGFPPDLLPEDLPFEPLPELPPELDFDSLPQDGVISGAIIQEVFDNTPAMEAGLAVGDVISAVDGEPVASPGDVVAAVRARAPGDELVLTILRLDAGEQLEIAVTLGRNPDEAGSAYIGVRLGGMLRFQSEGNPR